MAKKIKKYHLFIVIALFFVGFGLIGNQLFAAGTTYTSSQTGDWDDPATWGGTVPGDNDLVIVANGHTVTLDTSDIIARVQINSGATLTFDPTQSITLQTSGNVVVNGTLQMRPNSASITHYLKFINIDETKFVGGAFSETDVGLWVMDAGILDAVGTAKNAWSRATGGLTVGATSITVEDATGWRIGDTLQITPTLDPTKGTDTWNGYDQATISAIAGNVVTLSSALTKNHPEVNGEWRAEVLNTSRNVQISGTGGGRTHVIFHHSTVAQTVSNVEIYNVGPRQQDGKYTIGVTGRYGFHFHHGMNGVRGSVVDGVVVRNSGNHAVVPHASHGVTIRNTIAHNTVDDAFWFDPGQTNGSKDLVYDRNVASDVRAIPSFRGYRMAGFVLGFTAGNKITNSVAVGVEGNVDASGFEWPENTVNSTWEFNNNIGHNNKVNGIFTWQNGGNLHIVEDSIFYHNAEAGIDHGAYKNRYIYRNLQLYGNGTNGFNLHNVASDSEVSPMTLEDTTIDGAGITKNAITIQRHNPQVSLTSKSFIRDNDIKNLAANGKAINFVYNGIASGPGDDGAEGHSEGNHRELYDIENNTFDGDYEDYFSVQGKWKDLNGNGQVDFNDANGDGFVTSSEGNELFGILVDSEIRVVMPDGEILLIDSIFQDDPGWSEYSPWNVQRKIVQTAGTPLVEAGPQQSIQQPANTAVLSGTVTDGGETNPIDVTVTWTQLSGPASTITSPNDYSTNVNLPTVGQYVFRLTADDGTLTNQDEVTIQVVAANPTETVTETFSDGDAGSWPAQWTETQIGGTTDMAVLAGKGRADPVTGTSTYSQHINTHNSRDVDATVTFQVSGSAVDAGMIFRRNDDNPNTYYKATASTNNDFKISKVVNGTETVLENSSFNISSNVDWKMRVQIATRSGETTNILAKVWKADQSEPSDWRLKALNHTDPDLGAASGRFGLYGKSTNSNRYTYYDNYVADTVFTPDDVDGTDLSILSEYDLTGDGLINQDDLDILIARYRKLGTDSADFNGDQNVNVYDYSLLISNWAP